MKIKKILCILSCSFLLLNLVGCESFVRKFTRKSKKSDQAVEMVLVPEEYKGSNMTKEELYRQDFLYWKSWQEELINAFIQKSSLKKKIDCMQEALKNLSKMKMLLVEDAQKNLEVYITKSNDLLSYIQSDVYGIADDRNYRTARLLKSNIEQKFAYAKIRNYLK
ncbi:MAG: hypothetical protein PHC29_00880 [Candidatus Omnitrophica bacterium]|nr:hypothetical protein [Candidatus Omnitrophota bacterium]